MDVKRFIEILTQSLDTNGMFDNGELVDLITTRNEFGRTVGHEIAWKYDEQTLNNFLTEIIFYEPSTVPEVFECADNGGRQLGHYIAEFKDFNSLKMFLQLVIRLMPTRLRVLLEATISGGWNLAHIVAHYQGAQGFYFFLSTVLVNDPTYFPEMLKAETNNQWNFLLRAARYQNSQQLKYLLDQLLLLTPELITEQVCYRTKSGLSLIHLLVTFHSQALFDFYMDKLLPRLTPQEQAEQLAAVCFSDDEQERLPLGHKILTYLGVDRLQKYLAKVIESNNSQLAKVLEQKNEEGQDLIDVLVDMPFEAIGAVAYQLITANIPLGHKITTQLKDYKWEVLDHISHMPAQHQLQILAQLSDKKTPLGAYFDLRKDFMHRHFGINRDLITVIKELKKMAGIQSTNSNTSQDRIVNLELPEGIPAAYANVDCGYNLI